MSQETEILKALKKGRKLNPITALAEFGCFRLGARIKDLRNMGHNIETRLIKSANGKRFAEYRMVK